MHPSVDRDLADLYEMCMNKNFKTRPTASELLASDIISNWVKEFGVSGSMMNS